MRRINVAVSDEAEEVITKTKKAKGFANKDETIDYILLNYGKQKK